MNYDVIIIGAGSMGMAAGYYLSKSGKKTLLLDSFHPPHNKGSHHGETRIIRYAYAEGEEYVPFILKAQELWNELERDTGKPLFIPTGVLSVGNKESNFIQNTISSSTTYSLPLEVMNPAEVQNRWSGITLPNDFIGCFEPTSGVLKCEESIKAYQMLAEMNGATILSNSRVKEIHIQEEKVTIKTSDKTFCSDSLVVAAGAWSGHLLSMLDLNLPLTPVRKTFAWFDVNEKIYNSNDFPAFAFETSQGLYYGFPSVDGAGLKVGRHDGGERINPDEAMKQFGEIVEDEGDLIQFLNQYLPEIGSLKYGKTCMYTLTPDDKFVIDIHPKYSNVAIAAGFSGHGFKFSSAVGQALSNLIVSGKNEIDISQFSIDRFNN
ncbi:N-methyl-L-tryptophan oxidase [Metabacillus halosaccharovorans]|uniref:N-methyl-L-tryptophan oxidase n=1 Tax=Metabacillus halosaccharovorans TaxID=930124 RepID=UPI001C1F7057|nr:N-methyl-L-tryptophan oxidase [Metabacillus halosaccharovorans]MBU7595196.1 N-methyl-L-tryptophan oxidase [Metabacillus halosaccharovorans]